MKARDHRKLTEKAIEMFATHSDSGFTQLLQDKKKEVMAGADEADSSPVYTRITNWHFFKQNELLKPKTLYYAYIIPLPVTPTSESILDYRIKEMRKELGDSSSAKLGDLIGRTLHHVQDMSTPSHVVPVYHGPVLKDSFEKYSSENIALELQTIDITRDEFEKLRLENNTNIIGIYNSAAQKTLGYLYDNPGSRFEIEDESGDTIEVGWDLFWKRFNDDIDGCSSIPFDDIPGFGCFGPLGEDYGETRVNMNGDEYSIKSKVYTGLHRWVLREQVRDSVRLLLAVDSLRKA